MHHPFLFGFLFHLFLSYFDSTISLSLSLSLSLSFLRLHFSIPIPIPIPILLSLTKTTLAFAFFFLFFPGKSGENRSTGDSLILSLQSLRTILRFQTLPEFVVLCPNSSNFPRFPASQTRVFDPIVVGFLWFGVWKDGLRGRYARC